MASRIVIKGPVLNFWRRDFRRREDIWMPDHCWADCNELNRMNSLRTECGLCHAVLDDSVIVVEDENGDGEIYEISQCNLLLCGIIQTKCDFTVGTDVLYGEQKIANAVAASVNDSHVDPICIEIRYKLLYHPERGWLRTLESGMYMFECLDFEKQDVHGAYENVFWVVEGNRYALTKSGDCEDPVRVEDIASDVVDLQASGLSMWRKDA